MSFDLSSIQKGAVVRPPRILLHGVEKIGKSTFASQFPKPVFIPVKGEEGIDALDVASFPVINSFEDLMEIMKSLASDDHDYETVVLDSVSALEPLIWDYTCRQNLWNDIEAPGFGTGYVAALTTWTILADCLDHLRKVKDMTSILIGHVIARTFNDPLTEAYDVYDLDINKKAAAQLKRWADSILFCNRKAFVGEKKSAFGKTETVVSGGDMPMLYTQSRAAHEGGGRGVFGQLPYELPLFYQSFADAVSAAFTKKETSS